MNKSFAYWIVAFAIVLAVTVIGAKTYRTLEQTKDTVESIGALSDAATGVVEKVDVSGVIDVVEDKLDRINMSTVNDKIEAINIDLKNLFNKDE